jgi:hypothetical protein
MAIDTNTQDTGSAFNFSDTQGLPEILTNFLNQLLGDDRLGQMIGRGMEPVMAPFFRGNVSGPLGMNMYGTNNAFFNTTPDAGRGAYEAFNRQATQMMMQSSVDAVNEARRQQAQSFHMFAGRTPGQAAAMSNDVLNMTNIVSRLQFATHQPDLLMRGLEEASRFQGFASVAGLSGDTAAYQQQLNQNASNFNQALIKDYFGNMEAYGGLRGQEVGQIVAELNRTGRISNRNDADIQRSIGTVQEMTKTVRALRQFFQGDVADLIDQVNALTGADFGATFGTSSSTMLNRISATGFATGHTNQQMMALAGHQTQVLQQMGADPFSSLANAEDVAMFLGASRRQSMKLVNERRYRTGIGNMVARSNQSEAARLVTGAATYFSGQADREGNFDPDGLKKAEAFMNKAQALGENLNADSLVRLLKAEGIDATAADIMARGYTEEGELLRARGGGTQAAQNRQIAAITNSRRSTLQSMLEQRGINATEVFNRLGNKAMTVDNIRNALVGSVGEQEAGNMAGHLRRVFGIDAQNILGMNAAEADRMLATAADSRESQRLREQVGFRTSLQDLTSETGTIGGLRSISTLVERYAKGDLTVKKTFDHLAGNVGINIMDEGFRQLFGLTDDGTLDEAAVAKMSNEERIGLTRVFDAAMFGKMGDKMATAEQVKQAKQILADKKLTPAQRRRLAEKFARDHDAASIEKLEQGKIAGEIYKNLYGEDFGKDKGDEALDRYGDATQRASRVDTLADLTGDVIKDKEKKAAFLRTRDAYQQALKTREGSMAGVVEDFWAQGGKDLLNREEFEKLSKREAAFGKGGVEKQTSILENIESLIEGIIEKGGFP